MTILTVDEIISLQEKLIGRTGGSFGLRERGLLESAVYGASGSFGEVEAYPSIEEKAARLAYSLISNHAFVDGNKRIGILVMLLTLQLNDIELCYTQAELIALGLGVADNRVDYPDIYSWILSHKDAPA